MDNMKIITPDLPRSVVAEMAKLAGCEFKEIIGGFEFVKAGNDELVQDEHEDIAVG